MAYFNGNQVYFGAHLHVDSGGEEELKAMLDEIEIAVDEILAIQESLIGGDA